MTRVFPAASFLAGFLVAVGIMTGCGVVGANHALTPQSSTLAVIPATAEVRSGSTQAFSISVAAPSGNSRSLRSHSSGSMVAQKSAVWFVNGITGGNAAIGTIGDDGVYTAPDSLPSPNSVVITAKSISDPTLSGQAQVTLDNPIPQITSISPNSTPVGNFTLTVKGNRFVKGAQVQLAGAALATTFNSSTQLTATGAAAQTQSGNLQVSVKNPAPGAALSTTALSLQITSSAAIRVAVSPADATIRAMDSQQFSAAISGSANSKVTWSVNGVAGGNAALGTISASGLYTTPASLPNPNLVTITASSLADSSSKGSVTATIANPIPVVASVSPASVPTGTFTVVVHGSRFARGAQIQLGNTPLQTTFNSSSQLTATGTASQAGSVQVLVRNPDPGSSLSTGTVKVQITAPAATAPAPAPAPTAAAVNADVVVDAGKAVSETGGDDLAAAKNIYSSASAPESDGGLFPDWNLISSEFPMKRMRNINGLGDCALDSAGNLTGCSRLNGDLLNIKAYGLTPHVIVGQWAPSSIGGNPLQWGNSQWAQYDALCLAIVNYVANEYGGSGFEEALFEVGNELDTTTDPRDLWLTTNNHVNQGDPSRFAQFDTVYRHWAKAVDTVAKANPQKKIRIAGPSTGLWTVAYGSGALWHDQIVQKYAALGIRLDVVTLHIYGGWASDLAKYAKSIRDTLVASGNPNAEIWVTEWGASDLGDSYFGAINGSHEGAAWAVCFLLQALKGGVTGGSFLLVRDNQGHDAAGLSSNINEATWNHVANGSEYPKAIANAFGMFDRMKGTRRSTTVNTAKPDLLAIASSDSKSASLIVANYNYLFDYSHKNYSDLSTPQNVTVAFKNLPFDGPVTVDRYLIDEKTSNVDHWASAGNVPPSAQATGLQRVESYSATSTGGTLSLSTRQLGKSAVSLWIVHR